jgi:hypothetical protein
VISLKPQPPARNHHPNHKDGVLLALRRQQGAAASVLPRAAALREDLRVNNVLPDRPRINIEALLVFFIQFE